jgi:hypothetical protein
MLVGHTLHLDNEIQLINAQVAERRRAGGNWNSPWAFRVSTVVQVPLLKMFDDSTIGYPFNTVEGLELGLDAFSKCSSEIHALWNPWFVAARFLFGVDVLIPSRVRAGERRLQMEQSVAVTLEYFDYIHQRCHPTATPENSRNGIQSVYSEMMQKLENQMDNR